MIKVLIWHKLYLKQVFPFKKEGPSIEFMWVRVSRNGDANVELVFKFCMLQFDNSTFKFALDGDVVSCSPSVSQK